jgi:DNA-binding winged helix-turn-helix (wHTH) protein
LRFQFTDFVVDESTRQVLRGGTDVHVSPKAFDLLMTLIRERPRVLSKEDLHARLWPKTFVSDASLAMLVAEVRVALGESAREPRAIRTVHRHGYAFRGIAREIPPAVPMTDAAPAAAGAGTACCLVAASRQIPLHPGDNLVGRDRDAHVWLDSPSVSRRHARIRVEGDRVTLEDLASKNGTRVRNTRVTAVTPLTDGDELRFGSVDVTFRAWAADPTLSEAGS